MSGAKMSSAETAAPNRWRRNVPDPDPLPILEGERPGALNNSWQYEPDKLSVWECVYRVADTELIPYQYDLPSSIPSSIVIITSNISRQSNVLYTNNISIWDNCNNQTYNCQKRTYSCHKRSGVQMFINAELRTP